MPPFSNSLSRRWSPSELPILPFLAPRLFQPWPPSKSARVHLKRKTNRNDDDDEHSTSKVGEREFIYPQYLGDSSTNISVQSGTKYTRFSKRRTTPTSFTHGSTRHFSSRSDFGGIAEENGRDSPTPEDHSNVPQEFGSNARVKAQPGTAASTLQDSGMEGSLHISSSPRPLHEQSNAPSMDSRGVRRVPMKIVPGIRHLRSGHVVHHVPVQAEDAVKPGNIETSRLGDSFALSSCNYSRHTLQQSSSPTPPSMPQIGSLKGSASPPPSSSTSTPAQKSSNASGSSCQPTAAAKKAIPTMVDRVSWENRSKIPGQSVLRPSGKNGSLNAPGLFRRPKRLIFRPSEQFRRAKGPLLIRRKMLLNLRRLKAQGLATVQGPFQELCDQYKLWAKQQGLPELQTKYLKIKIDAEANIKKLQMWSSQFAIINQRHEDALKDYPKLEYKKVALSKFPMAIKLLFIKQDNAAVLANVWRRVPAATRSDVWQELMLTSMDQYPESTLKLLLATYQEPHLPPQWAANDCLDFVVSHYFGSEGRKPALDSFTASDLRHIFESIRYLQLRGLQLSSRSMYLLQLMMTNKEFKTFYFVLAGTGQHLTGKTLLRFVYRFARSGETDLAFKVVQQATRQGINLNLERWPQICNVLLTRRYRDPNAQVNDTELFEFMLHHGLRPGICTYNILIQNSLQARDHITAWQIYDMMIENGVMADGYTYSIMLNDAKVRRDDAAVSKLAHWMHEDGIRDDHTVTDILDSIFLFHRQEYFKHPPSERKSLPTSFLRMLPVYMQNFNVEPLAQLIPRFEENFLGPVLEKSADKEDGISVASTYQTPSRVEPDQSNPDLSVSPIPGIGLSNNEPGFERHLMEPNPVTLIVMLKSYIGSVRNYECLLDFYDHFKSLISMKNPIVAPLLKRAQIYNHLLVGLGHLGTPMHYCLKIVADMQAPHSEQRQSAPATEADQSHDGNDTVEVPITSDETEIGFESDDISSNSTDDSFRPPPPSIHTWTTLLHLFMQRRQPRAAEKVLQIMIEKEGLEPNQATWNALTMGYMRLQDPLMVSDALIRTKKSGFVVDHIMSSRWWLRFQARARLSEALQASSDGNEISLADVANAIESETEVVDPADDEIIDEEVLEATASKTGDIYRIIKRRLHAVNSPVYPNWIFDAMLRADEGDFIGQESESILDDVVESRPESPQFPENPDSAIEQESGQLLNSQDTGRASQRPSETEDERELRLLPANRIIARRTG
ncbi:hypothetical protein DSL72_001643 [Monilinia vaccinii-corymbosi]|uniref:Pentacotripeptide-repeat region of PRORP domain-containing protein n=1 Tax=Monilinia vaccinii-corymbosi TaxID=61207 RepID=A0A8A3P696_9HELO|nr:hypothetical protein DSL72_001643 [Monilinia vaccinii-corymbosi]